jgi:hypothetical protein
MKKSRFFDLTGSYPYLQVSNTELFLYLKLIIQFIINHVRKP